MAKNMMSKMTSIDPRKRRITKEMRTMPSKNMIKGVVLTATTTAGSVVFKDGGTSGTARLTINTPAVADFHDIFIPGEGILFNTDIYVDVTNVSSVTIFYG